MRTNTTSTPRYSATPAPTPASMRPRHGRRSTEPTRQCCGASEGVGSGSGMVPSSAPEAQVPIGEDPHCTPRRAGAAGSRALMAGSGGGREHGGIAPTPDTPEAEPAPAPPGAATWEVAARAFATGWRRGGPFCALRHLASAGRTASAGYGSRSGYERYAAPDPQGPPWAMGRYGRHRHRHWWHGPRVPGRLRRSEDDRLIGGV